MPRESEDAGLVNGRISAESNVNEGIGVVDRCSGWLDLAIRYDVQIAAVSGWGGEQ